jgi:DNA-binding CsgD family transcriptional regulator/tetratricopeptide (TPR) repeat protein
MNRIAQTREELVQQMLKAAQGRPAHGGLCLLVSGEAGVGKTTLVQHFIDSLDPPMPVLWGACEGLATPRPLGPLLDMAASLPESVSRCLRSGRDQLQVYDAMLAYLNNGPRTYLVWIEDLHWIDHATLDLLRFLGRRLARCNVVLVLTYRDDKVGKGSALTTALADLPSAYTLRLQLQPLPFTDVATLARSSPLDAKSLFELTGGNAFLLSEMLAAPGDDIPPTVRDAVLARQHDLCAVGRTVCEAVSVWSGPVPLRVLEGWLAPQFPHLHAVLDDCMRQRVLELHDNALRFRHEVARRVVYASLPPLRKRELHTQAFTQLAQGTQPDFAHQTHQALGAGMLDQVLELAPLAASDAARRGAHREAATHYERALDHSGAAPLQTQAQLHEAWAHEAELAWHLNAKVLASRRQAARIWNQLGMPEREGANWRALAHLHWLLGEPEEAQRMLDQAIGLLESVDHGRELAMAYSMQAQFLFNRSDHASAMKRAQEAIAQALASSAPEAHVHALNSLACSKWMTGIAEGESMLLESLQRALESGFHEHAARAYASLVALMIHQCRFREAEHHCREGRSFAQRNELAAWESHLTGLSAQLWVRSGDYEQARSRSMEALDAARQTVETRHCHQLALGMALSRSGARGAFKHLREAMAVARDLGAPHLLFPACQALAEAYWQEGRPDAAEEVVRVAWTHRGQLIDPWLLGQVAIWGHRLALDLQDVPLLAPPFQLEREGRIHEASQLWAQAGAPFEQALCLFHGGAEQLAQAIELLTQVQAKPGVALARERARQFGYKGVRRGPYSPARNEPHGLTAREQQVRDLMADGLSNAEISRRIQRSVRTVENHASSVLAKLGVSKRGDIRRLTDSATD